jgi:uncharacterized protein (DUF2235 family)
MKRIVICMDGTWQNLRQDSPTNIGLIARSVAHKETVLDAAGNPTGEYIHQTVIYTHGVGSNVGALAQLTFGGWVMSMLNKVFGGALGEGLEDGILDTYLRLAFNYEEGDEIYLFGFSRGAFAARKLAGVINTAGILSRRSVQHAWDAFQLYYDKPPLEAGRNPDGSRYTIDTPPRIAYIGVFDTVVQRGIWQVLDAVLPKIARRYKFKNYRMLPNVESARHAMAIDENRRGFPPTPWDGLSENNDAAHRLPGADTSYNPYQQRWFIGRHGDIGGGDGSPLASAALKWVAEGAAKRGLRFYAKHGDDISPMEEEIKRAGPDVYRASLGRGKFWDILKLHTWPGAARKIWSDRHKRPVPEDLVLYLDESVLQRCNDDDLRPRYKPAALRPFREAMKKMKERA